MRPVSPAVEPAAGAPTGLPGVRATRIAVTLPAGARTVAVVGDFNGWDTGATRLSPVGSHGEWAATVPLAPGRHVYAFVVDGVEWRVDPLAPQVPDAGFGPANALIVDGGP
jgi:1,4-alpha-glucan branching enzyme